MGIGGRLLSSLAAVRNEAATELGVILARRDAGETAENLGLTWRADRDKGSLHRFIESIDRDTLNYPVEGLRELVGRERTLVENLILLRLDRDRRAVRAAGALRIGRAIEPLRELIRTAEGHARTEIQEVLDTLTG